MNGPQSSRCCPTSHVEFLGRTIGVSSTAFSGPYGPEHHGAIFARNLRGGLSLSDLEGESLALRGACEMPRGALWPENLRMRIVARTERDELALRLVAEGLGIAIAPRSLATDAVVARHVKGIDAARSIG